MTLLKETLTEAYRELDIMLMRCDKHDIFMRAQLLLMRWNMSRFIDVVNTHDKIKQSLHRRRRGR